MATENTFTKFTSSNKETLEAKSAKSLPNSPTASGWSATQIKKKLYESVLYLYDLVATMNSELDTALSNIKSDTEANELALTRTKLVEKLGEATSSLSGLLSATDKGRLDTIYSNYATEYWIQQQGYLTQHQSLSGYATEYWIQQQGYLTQHQSLANYYTKDQVDAMVNSFITKNVSDLTYYYTKTTTDNLLASKEDTSNKVTELTSAVTNTQYPGALCVFNAIQSLKETAEGKNRSYAISTSGGGANANFSNNATVNSFEAGGTLYLIDGTTINISDLKQGDVIYIVETDVPDRWVANTSYNAYKRFYRLETEKPDLTVYGKLAQNNTWTGSNTFQDITPYTNNQYSLGNLDYQWDYVYTRQIVLNGVLIDSVFSALASDNTFTGENTFNDIINTKTIYPLTDGNYNIGAPSDEYYTGYFKYIYCINEIYEGGYGANNKLSNKYEAKGLNTLLTTAPTSAITDGGIHIVHLASSTGVTEYDGYIYIYDEEE